MMYLLSLLFYTCIFVGITIKASTTTDRGTQTSSDFNQVFGAYNKPEYEDSPERALHQILPNYVRNERPKQSRFKNNSSGLYYPLIVQVNLYIYSFSSISIVNMDYTVDLLLRQRWIDHRLKLGKNYNFTYLPISYVKDMIWIPDLFFRNAKQGFLHDMTTPNYLIWLNSDGIITFSQKISMKLSCHMSLRKFPLDTQTCSLNIGSYGYPKTDLEFRWWNYSGYEEFGQEDKNVSMNEAVKIRQGLEMNEFNLLEHRVQYCKAEYSSTGEFSCLVVDFSLKRRFGFYLIYAYLPSFLIAVIAWISFFVDHEAVPARISIGLLCVLALITQSAAILTQIPPVSYTKAIDVWFFTCLAFVVVSLLEYAIANSLARQEVLKGFQQKLTPAKRNYYIITTPDALKEFLEITNIQAKSDPDKLRSDDDKEELDLLSSDAKQWDPNLPNLGDSPNHNWKSGKGIKIHKLPKPAFLDYTFAIGYPIAFAIFNLFYWTYYLAMENK